MELSYDYQLALAEYWEGRPAMEPNVWVPGVPLQMTVAAPPASNDDQVVISIGQQQQLVQKTEKGDDDHHQQAIELFRQASHSLKHEVDKMKTKMHLFPPTMQDLKKLYAAPKVVSIGPYYHGKTPELLQMESTKHAAASHFVEESRLPIEEVYGAVCAVAEEARGYYDADKLKDLSDDEFKPMMFFDGCFLLQYMLYWCKEEEDHMDPSLYSVFSSSDTRIFCDVTLLENQLPWVVLETLQRLMRTPVDLELLIGRVKIDKLHIRQVLEFDPSPLDLNYYPPPHLLGLIRHHIVGYTANNSNNNISSSTTAQEPAISEKVKKVSWSVGVVELAEIGIEVTPNETKEELKNMRIKRSCFTGELRLASVSLDDASATFLVNMAALEMCMTADFNRAEVEMSTVCSYLCLLGMVTDSETDVQELRNKHVLEGGAGLTNEDVLKLFTGIEKDLRPGQCYYDTVLQIENYRSNRWWWIKVYRFFYKNRNIIVATLSFIAAIAAFLGTLKSFQ